MININISTIRISHTNIILFNKMSCFKFTNITSFNDMNQKNNYNLIAISSLLYIYIYTYPYIYITGYI